MLDTIPFEYASPQAPLIIVNGKFDEKRADTAVVVDTGAVAPFSVFLSVAAAKSLGLAMSEEVFPQSTTAMGGDRQGYRTSDLPYFSLGPIKLSHIPIAVLPMIDRMQHQIGHRVEAIIGYQFLHERRFSINYVTREIDLSAPVPADLDAIQFTLAARKPVILVQAEVNGIGPFMFEIDTGATVTSLSPDAAMRAHVTSHGDGILTGAGGGVNVQRGAATVAVGSVKFDLPNVVITNSMADISAAAGTQIDGILGVDYFYRTTLTIDYPGAKAWISPAGPKKRRGLK